TSKLLTFSQWADWVVERRSKPPFRSAGNHQQNVNALKSLRPVFGELALSEITAEAVENYLGDRLQSGRRIHTKFGLQLRGRIKPATAHQEFRILSHILNVAVKQKRLAANPCVAVEFPVSIKKSTRKPHYMSATEQAKIEIVAPSYLRNVIVIIAELGLRYKKELLPMKKEQVPYVTLYELRHTFATRLSAGGVADHMVTQMLRQSDADVFKRYSQAKLGMMREALAKLDRRANERESTERVS